MARLEFSERNGKDSLELEFEVLDNPVAQKWNELVRKFQSEPLTELRYSWDSKEDVAEGLNTILADMKCYYGDELQIRKITTNTSLDYINYLHAWHVTMKEKGQQDKTLNGYLMELNKLIHCFEAHEGKSYPILSVLVENSLTEPIPLQTRDFEMFNHALEFGGIYTNYSSVGKTLSALAKSDDDILEQFVPQEFFTADFTLSLYTDEPGVHERRFQLCKDYFEKHKEFFQLRGYNDAEDPRLRPGYIQLARLKTQVDQKTILTELRNYRLSSITTE